VYRVDSACFAPAGAARNVSDRRLVAWGHADMGHRGDHALGRDQRAVARRRPRHHRLLGLGTPKWDFGARGTLLGVTRGTTSAHVVRAVLDGVAHRSVDLVEAAERDTGLDIGALRVDGGMSANPTFIQALADLSRRAIEVSPVADATTLGAAFLAGLAVGVWNDIGDAVSLWEPQTIIEPGGDRSADRARWADAINRAAGWIPELSALDF
jgi:glycerol kinase